MIELTVLSHAESFHHPARPLVVDDREGDDLVEVLILEAEPDGFPRGLGCVTTTPVGPREPPSDLNARGECGVEARDLESGEPDELRFARELESPKRKRVGGAPKPLRQSVARDSCLGPAQPTHHFGICVQSSKGVEVSLAPRPENEPLRSKNPSGH